MAVAEKTTVERVVMTDGFTLKLTVEEAETLPDHPAELLSGGLTFSDYGTAV